MVKFDLKFSDLKGEEMPEKVTIQSITHMRERAKIMAWTALVLVVIRLALAGIALHNAHDPNSFIKWGSWAIGMGAMILTYIAFFTMLRAWVDFRGAWGAFYSRHYMPLVDQLTNDGYNIPWSVSKWRFLRVPDLKEFERTLIDGLRATRNTIDRERQSQKWARINVGHIPQLAALMDEYAVDELRRRGFADGLASYASPRKRREYLERLGAKLAYDRWKSQLEVVSQSPTSVAVERQFLEDVELRSYEVRASQVTSPRAVATYQEGLGKTERRERLRLFGNAIRTEEKETDAPDPEQPTPVTANTVMPKAEVKYLSLQGFARERLVCLRDLIGKDWEMCREIILVLLEPGRHGARFNKRYFAEDTVMVQVRRQYNLNVGRPFDPSTFKDAVAILFAHGVLVSKPKTDERTLSLSTRVKGAPTAQGQKVIVAALQLKRELGGFV